MPWISSDDSSNQSMDEHLDDLLMHIPALINMDNAVEDNMASLVLGNFAFHDPRSIQSAGSCFHSLAPQSP